MKLTQSTITFLANVQIDKRIFISASNSNFTMKKKYKRTRAYIAWSNMKQRCQPDYMYHKNYYDKGITVCRRWILFANFLEDMKEPPSYSYSLDRVDNNKGYYKENCRWADSKTQCNNRDNNRSIEFDGIKLNINQWSRLLRISPRFHDVFRTRLHSGWSLARSACSPIQNRMGNQVKHN